MPARFVNRDHDTPLLLPPDLRARRAATTGAAAARSIRLLVSQGVRAAPNDKEQRETGVAAVSPVIASVAAVLIASGFYRAKAVAAVEKGDGTKPGPRVYAATGRQPHGRRVEQLEKRAGPPAPGPGASAIEVLQHRLCTQAGRALHALRKQTVEPVFGIIKAALGFRRFSLRGLEKVRAEWTLVTLAYNLKRLFHLGARLQAAGTGGEVRKLARRTPSRRPAPHISELHPTGDRLGA